jgi:hypothetical protein
MAELQMAELQMAEQQTAERQTVEQQTVELQMAERQMVVQRMVEQPMVVPKIRCRLGVLYSRCPNHRRTIGRGESSNFMSSFEILDYSRMSLRPATHHG